MARVIGVLICVWLAASSVSAQIQDVDNNINSNFNQATSMIGGGTSESDSSAVALSGGSEALNVVSLNSTSNIRQRTAPLGIGMPYLPLWNHGGWGLISDGYFANGPSRDNLIYERTYNPEDKEDMDQLRGVLSEIPYENPIAAVGGLLNGIFHCCGAPCKLHHGRGFEIANSVIRHRRPEGKPLMVFIDHDIDKEVLQKAGYSYVGKISVGGKETFNWDQVYDATVAEALPWDVDLLLVSGGMKGVTVGSNISFPNAAMGYSQVNYSLSLVGGVAKGITEAKGKPVISGEAYRYSPRLRYKRSMPRQFYESLQARYAPDEHSHRYPRL